MSRLPIYTNLSVGLCLNLVGPTCVSYTALFDRGKYKAREYVFILPSEENKSKKENISKHSSA